MTLLELKTRVLQHLEVLATNTDPNADDAAIVGSKYASLYQMLLTKELVNWVESGDIPDEVSVPLTMMLAYMCASSFGVIGADYDRLRAEGALDVRPISLAEKQLRVQIASAYVDSPAQPDYF